jgi:hypothetical protein
VAIKHRRLTVAGLAAGVLLALVSPAGAQIPPCSTLEVSTNLPPVSSPALVRCIEVRFHPDGTPSVDAETYNYYIRPTLRPSLRSQNTWVPYREADALSAFSRLSKTGFLDDLWVEVIDEPYENGVMGKHVIFHMEERLRLKGIDYAGASEVPVSKIEEALRDKGIFRPESTFVEEEYLLARKIRSVIKDLYSEQGFPDVTVEIKKTPMPGDLRVFRLTFEIKAGPKARQPEHPPSRGV